MKLAALALFTASLHGATFCVTVAGLGGEPDYEQRFAAQAQELDKLLKSSGGGMEVQTLHGPAATKAAFETAVQAIARKVTAEDALMVVLIGHGSFDGVEYKFNMHGPDLSGTEMGALLDRVPTGRQLVVNATSASGASFHALQKPNRTVVTATKSGTEKNATVFSRYWVDALRDSAADTDKNEVISALEAFRCAEQKTKAFYETNKRLATEHPALDGGDQQGPVHAGRFTVLRIGSAQIASNDPAKRALLARREQLEVKIDELKLQKAAMPVAEYKQQLQALLLELARTQEELDK